MDIEQSRQILLENSRSKKNGEFPAHTNHQGQLTNPICGDSVEIKLQIEDQKILSGGFKATACAICTASASLLCGELADVFVDDIIKMTQHFEQAILLVPGEPWPPDLSTFQCFEHLRTNPSRKTCALLPFVNLRSILKKAKLR